MRTIDLSLVLYDGLKTHSSHPRVIINEFVTHAFSAPRYKPPCKGFATMQVIISDHGGTHVDSPLHFYPDGKDMESQPLDHHFGEAILLDVSKKGTRDPIDVKLIEATLKRDGLSILPGDIVLFRAWPGAWGEGEFHEVSALTVEAARWLCGKGMKAVGIDLSNLETGSDMTRAVHVYLLKERVPIYENLFNLDKIPVKRFQFFGLPLRLKGCTGSPVRAMALVND
jgi:kynurenine formamidase